MVNIVGVFFTFFMGPWMNRYDWNQFFFGDSSRFNTAACTAQGFILYFAEVYFLTTYAGLGTLYFLIVRRGWTKHDWEKKRIKAAFLLPPVIVSAAFSVPPLFYQMYNPSPPMMCMLNQYPPFCEEEDSDVQCTRGQNALLAQQIELLYALICNLVIIIFMGLLVLSVYRTEKKGDKYLSKGQAKKRDNTIETAWQGVRYGGAITVPYVPLYVWLGVSLRGSSFDETNFLVWFVSLTQSIGISSRYSSLSNSSFPLLILSIYILFSLLSLDLIMVSGFYYFLFAMYLHTNSNFSFSCIAHFTPVQHAFTSFQSIKHTGNVIKICL